MTPPVKTYAVECHERHESPMLLIVTLDPYQAFALAEAVVARSIDPPPGSHAGDFAHVTVTEFAVVQIRQWERERLRPPTRGAPWSPWWATNDASARLAVERWSPWFTYRDDSTIGHYKRTVVPHVSLLREIGERHDIIIQAAENAMDLARSPHAAHEFGSVLETL